MIDHHTLVEAGRRLAHEASRFAQLGWMRGTAGNLSVVLGRDPLVLAVTASGIDKGELDATDIVAVDAAGAALAVAGALAARPSAEAGLHAHIAARTGAGAVVHVHAVPPVAAADRWPGGLELAHLEMLKGIGRSAEGEVVRIPVIANDQDMRVLAERFDAAWQPGVPGVLVARHGIYAWGDDLMAARHHTEILVWLCEAALAGVVHRP